MAELMVGICIFMIVLTLVGGAAWLSDWLFERKYNR